MRFCIIVGAMIIGEAVNPAHVYPVFIGTIAGFALGLGGIADAYEFFIDK